MTGFEEKKKDVATMQRTFCTPKLAQVLVQLARASVEKDWNAASSSWGYAVFPVVKAMPAETKETFLDYLAEERGDDAVRKLHDRKVAAEQQEIASRLGQVRALLESCVAERNARFLQAVQELRNAGHPVFKIWNVSQQTVNFLANDDRCVVE